MGKYFTVDVKPTITASLQHTAFGTQDVLFDWTEFQVPRGSSRLLGATALIRPKGDGGPTANNFGMMLVFSKTNTQSFGTINSAAAHRPSNDFLGFCEIGNAGSHMGTTMISTAVGMSGRIQIADSEVGSGLDTSNLILTPSIITGDNVGYDTLYVAAKGNLGAFDFTSINTIDDDNIASVSPGTTLVMDDGSAGGSMDIREHFIAGDVLHAHDDAVIGTVASVTDDTTLELEEAIATSVLAANDVVYNIHPIRIILHFEK